MAEDATVDLDAVSDGETEEDAERDEVRRDQHRISKEALPR